MADIITYPLPGIDYGADDVSLFNVPIKTGVPSTEEDFRITVTGPLDIVIGAGLAWLHLSRWAGRVVASKASVPLTLPAADTTRARYDLILLRYDGAAGGSVVTFKQGTPASSPQIPSLTRTPTVYEVGLYAIRRPGGSARIDTAEVTDLRPDPAWCGLMSSSVSALPGDVMLQQFEARTEEYIQQLRASVAGPQGTYDTAAQLRAAVPQGQRGYWAIVMETKSLWIWDPAARAWHDSQTQYDLSALITSAQLQTALASYVTSTQLTTKLAAYVKTVNGAAPDSSGNAKISVPAIYSGSGAPSADLGKVGDLYLVI